MIIEVGFNAGHSTALLLSTFPTVEVWSFDLCEHPYVDKAHVSVD